MQSPMICGRLAPGGIPWADAEFPPIDCNGFPLLGLLQARSSIEHDLQVLLPVEANAQLGLGIAREADALQDLLENVCLWQESC